MWRGLLQYAAHPPDVPTEGGQALLQALAVPNVCKHLVKENKLWLLMLMLCLLLLLLPTWTLLLLLRLLLLLLTWTLLLLLRLLLLCRLCLLLELMLQQGWLG